MQNNESQLQIECIKWWNLQYPQYYGLLFAIPNGSQRNVITAVILKKEGVISGVSDLILLMPNKCYHGLCIEMKFGKNKQSENQIIWQSKVIVQGYKYVVCYSFDSFMEIINNYLADKL